ncbi:MAG: hypothetical protein R2788_10440 [Saprospiraceae bacterium]
MKHITLMLALSFCLSPIFSQKYDYQWAMGYSYGAGNSKFGISIIDFTHQEITVSPFNLDYFPIGIGVGSTFICDKSGELLLLSNNCEVFDKNLQALPGSYPLVTSEIAVWDCEDYGDTPILESSLLLPGLGNDSIFYLINKDNVISQEYVTVINLGLYFSKIRLQKDSSLTFLGQEQILTDTLNGARLTAGINNDGTKWWVMVKKHFSDVFHLFLVGGEEGVEGPFTQAVGDVLDDVEMQTSTSISSPVDGKMLALHSDLNQALLYDFNNETGVLSNFRRISIYLPRSRRLPGPPFPLDSKLLYVTAGRPLPD